AGRGRVPRPARPGAAEAAARTAARARVLPRRALLRARLTALPFREGYLRLPSRTLPSDTGRSDGRTTCRYTRDGSPRLAPEQARALATPQPGVDWLLGFGSGPQCGK